MNNYNCEIVADSVNTSSDRITTFKLTYPRIVHAELMTHRMFSRNAASSRAVPIKKMIESVKNNMFTPLAIQKAHKGMQGSDYFKGQELEEAKKLWIESAELALQQAEKMKNLGITKQLINRILEPYQYYQVLVTATEWENFFKLRCPQYTFHDESEEYIFKSKKNAISILGSHEVVEYSDTKPFLKNLTDIQWLKVNQSQADIHIQAIAELMWDAYNESEPRELKSGGWHTPFGDNFDDGELHKIFNNKYTVAQKDIDDLKIKIAVARCARISYQTLGDDPKIDYKADIRLHDALSSMEHWSPFEHVAKAMTEEKLSYYYVSDGPDPENFHTGWCRNLKGFIQYRSMLDD